MTKFTRVGIVGRYRSGKSIDTVQALIHFLEQKKVSVSLDTETKEHLPQLNLPVFTKSDLAEKCDLLLVVGGDGSLLGAAKMACDNNVPVLGINRGTLGFLTDISPDNFEAPISAILDGHYDEESRFLLNAYFVKNTKKVKTYTALNDVVLMPGDIPHMIEFEIHINDKFMCKQRADGLIIATPTGSTAYALSAGGPILHPSLDAIVLVPMFPHKLSSRPIVVTGSSQMRIVITSKTESSPKISCDGQERITLESNTLLHVEKKQTMLRLLHPKHHDYFETLRNKLGWEETRGF